MPDPNLAKRARAAIDLTQAELAKLLGVKHQLLSRWEKGAKMSALAVTLMVLVEREPEAVLRCLSDARPGAAPGYAGDGGPPPARRNSFQYEGDPVDEHGFVRAQGERQEEGFGWGPGEMEVPETEFEFEFEFDEDDPMGGGAEVPGYRPEF